MRCLALVALVAAFFIAPAQAQGVCGPRDNIVKRLADGHQEARYAMGLAANGSLVEVFVAPSGSWTILVTRPGGPSCVAGAGMDWTLEVTPAPTSRGQGT